jgi:hypothetical protein
MRRSLRNKFEERAMPDFTPRGRTHSPWPIEELVLAQRMACEGKTFQVIAEALGRPVKEVLRQLDPEPATRREEFAMVAYPHLKGR